MKKVTSFVALVVLFMTFFGCSSFSDENRIVSMSFEVQNDGEDLSGGNRSFLVLVPDYESGTLSFGTTLNSVEGNTIGSEYFDRFLDVSKILSDIDIADYEGGDTIKVDIGFGANIESKVINFRSDEFPEVKNFFDDIVILMTEDVY